MKENVLTGIDSGTFFFKSVAYTARHEQIVHAAVSNAASLNRC